MLPQDSDSRGSRLDSVRRADPHPEGEEEEPLHLLPSERLHLLREREAPRAFPTGHGPGEGLRRRLERPRPDEAIDATRPSIALPLVSRTLCYHLSHQRTISARFISVHDIANDRDRANSVPQDFVGRQQRPVRPRGGRRRDSPERDHHGGRKPPERSGEAFGLSSQFGPHLRSLSSRLYYKWFLSVPDGRDGCHLSAAHDPAGARDPQPLHDQAVSPTDDRGGDSPRHSPGTDDPLSLPEH